jgi:hypothetical protein
MGSLRRRTSKAHSHIGWQLVNDLGILLVEVAQQLGICPSGILKILARGPGGQKELTFVNPSQPHPFFSRQVPFNR